MQIPVQSQDQQTIQTYFRHAEPGLGPFLKHFGLDEAPSQLL